MKEWISYFGNTRVGHHGEGEEVRFSHSHGVSAEDDANKYTQKNI